MSEETASTAAGGGAAALSAFYRLEAGALLAYGGLAIAIVLAITAKAADHAALWLAAVVALIIALHNWPLSRQLATALSVSDYGFFLDGLGLIAWSSIKAARMEERQWGKTKLPELIVDMDAEALNAAMSADIRRGLRRFQYRPWRVADGHILRVDLQPLGVDSRALLSAITPRLEGNSSGH